MLNYGLLSLRCRGVCEGCGKPNNLDPHHIMGREDEPFSSMVQLLAGLCRECHRKVTGELGRGIDVGLRARLSSDALARLRLTHGTYTTLNEALRRMKKAYRYDESSNTLKPFG